MFFFSSHSPSTNLLSRLLPEETLRSLLLLSKFWVMLDILPALSQSWSSCPALAVLLLVCHSEFTLMLLWPWGTLLRRSPRLWDIFRFLRVNTLKTCFVMCSFIYNILLCELDPGNGCSAVHGQGSPPRAPYGGCYRAVWDQAAHGSGDYSCWCPLERNKPAGR